MAKKAEMLSGKKMTKQITDVADLDKKVKFLKVRWLSYVGF